MKWLSRLVAITLLVILLIAALGVFVVSTHTGLRWTLSALQSLLPGTLEVEGLEGRLASPLSIESLRYHDASLQLDISHVVLEWQPGRLLERELGITRLHVGSVDVVTAPSPETEPQPVVLPEVRLPLAIRVADAKLDALSVRGSDGTQQLEGGDMRTALNFDGNRLEMTRLEGKLADLTLSLSGELVPAGPYPLDLQGRYTLHREGSPPVVATLAASGNLAQMQVEHRTEQPTATRLAASLSSLLEQPTWDAQLDVPKFDIRAVAPDMQALSVQGTVRSRGSLDRYWFDVEAKLDGDQIPQGTWTLGGEGTTHSVDIQRLRGETAAGTLSGQAQIQDLATTPRWTADLQIEQLDTTRMDATWEALIVDGSAHSSGTLDAYSFSADAHIRGSRIPEGQWSVKGTGSARSIDVEQLRGAALDGKLTASLTLQWDPQLEWRFSTEASSIDPGVHWPEWPGSLDFAAHGKGSKQDGRYRAETELTRLSGTLVQQEVAAHARLSADHQGFNVSALDVKAGAAHLSAQGTLSDRWDLKWDLQAPELQALYHPAQGSLSANGRLSGARDNPSLSMRMEARELAWQQYQAQSLHLVLDWLPDASKASRLDLQAAGLSSGEQQISRLSLEGSGPAGDHRIQLKVDTESLDLSSSLAGGYRDRQWQGSVTALDLTAAAGQVWRLRKPAPAKVSAEHAELGRLCLTSSGQGQGCLEGDWSAAEGWRAGLDASAIPLTLLQPFLPQGTGVEGELAVTARAEQSADGQPQGELEITSREGGLVYQSGDQQSIEFPYRNFVTSARLQQGLARLSSSAALGQGGQLDAQFKLPISALEPPTERLEGTLRANLDELGFLHALIPQVEEVQGSLVLDLTLGGTIRQPDLDLDLALRDGEVGLPAQGITISDIRLHAEPGQARGQIPFSGHAESGSGDLDISGNFFAGRDGDWRVELAVRGSRFLVVDVPEYRVKVSPDLHIDMTPSQAQVEGKVVIADARLRPKQHSGAEQPSSDVVIVREDEAEQARFAVRSKVRIELGDTVRFDGFGLKGRFTGSVLVADAPNQLISGTGEIRIVDGTYKAYGQNLKIERGRLILVGGPLENPGLDVRAVREVGDVTAGLHITGDVQEPKVTVFSDPAMSETEALSYLVLGRPLPQDDTEERDKVTSASAALALGVGAGSLLGEKFGEQVGIDEVGLETESATGEVTLKLGTYLTPDLFVGYGRGLANQVNSFLVRYQLTRSLSVETESSSESQGGDIFYTIERP